jgi:hypothetical protein
MFFTMLKPDNNMNPLTVLSIITSVADRDPESGAFLTPGSGMDKNQDPDPG